MFAQLLSNILGAYLPSVEPTFFDARIGEKQRVIYVGQRGFKIGVLLNGEMVKVAVEKKNGIFTANSVGVTVLLVPGAYEMDAKKLIKLLTGEESVGLTVAHTNNLGGRRLDGDAVEFLRFLGLMVRYCAEKISPMASPVDTSDLGEKGLETAEAPPTTKPRQHTPATGAENVVNLAEFRRRRK